MLGSVRGGIQKHCLAYVRGCIRVFQEFHMGSLQIPRAVLGFSCKGLVQLHMLGSAGALLTLTLHFVQASSSKGFAARDLGGPQQLEHKDPSSVLHQS